MASLKIEVAEFEVRRFHDRMNKARLCQQPWNR